MASQRAGQQGKVDQRPGELNEANQEESYKLGLIALELIPQAVESH